jgi:hypothetical protein
LTKAFICKSVITAYSGEADHGSDLMAITIPGKPIRVPAGTRSRFRDDADQKSADRGMVIGIPGIEF